jgi:hypothetical protein
MTSRLDRRDFRFYAITCGLALLTTAAVYVYAYLSVPRDHVFSGFILNSHDGYSYQIYANHSAHQGPMIDNAWALKRLPPAYFNLIWFLMGRFVVLGVPFIVAYHALQVLAGAAMCLAILALMKQFFRDRVMAWCAYLLASFGAGFGWIVAAFSSDFFGGSLWTADILHGDSFPVTCFWTQPHLVVSQAMLVSVYLFMYLATVTERRVFILPAAAVTLAMGFSHPYHFVTILPVLVAWHLVLTFKHGARFASKWLNLVVLFCCMLPGLIYYRHFIASSPNFSYWAGSNVIRTSGWLSVVLGFGLIMILAFLGYRGFLPLKKFTDRYLLIALWAPINFAMHFSYPLFFFEAKLGEGLIFPLSILATWAFFGSVVPFFRRKADNPTPEVDIEESPTAPPAETAPAKGRLAWAVALAALTLPTTGLNMANMLHELTTGRPYYAYTLNTKMKVHKAERAALEFLAKHTSGFPLVLVGRDSGLILPAFAPVRGFVGHVTNTAEMPQRMQVVRGFYSAGATDETRRQTLSSYDIGYVWWGIDEDRHYGGRRPRGVPYLRQIFDNGYVTIYQVVRSAL